MTPTDCKFLSFTDAQSLLKLMSIESMKLSKHLIFCCPFLLLPSIFPSIRVFSNESALCIRWPKDWSFSNSSSNEYSGLTSFQIDWFDLLAVQGTLESSQAPQLETINFLAFSPLYGPTFTSIHDYWKNHSFDSMDLCQQMMSLLFNTEVCHIFPSKVQVSFNVMAAITVCSDSGTPNMVSITASTFPPFYLPWSDGNKCHDLHFFLMLSFKPTFSLSSFTLIKRIFSFSSFSATRMVSSAYLRLLMFLPGFLIPVCDSPAQDFT